MSLTINLSNFIKNGETLTVSYVEELVKFKEMNDNLSTPLASISDVNVTLTADAVIPTVTAVTSTTSDGYYKSGQAISSDVTFSEDVIVSGTPQLQLETGTTDQKADYASGSGSNKLTFTYNILTGDASADLDYVYTSSLALNGGKIVDVSNNAANLTLASPGSTGSLGAVSAILVDTTAPNVVISAISYDSSNNVIYIDGTGMDDVASFDWTKLKLDINSDDSSTADHTFSSN